MKPIILIDGHNLIHRVAAMRELMQTNPEHARHELIRKLVQLLSRKNLKIHLFFDGDRVGQPSNQKIQGIHITYSVKPQTADSIIKLYLDKQNYTGNVLVVSSDNSVYQYAKTSKAQVMRAEEFYQKYLHFERSDDLSPKEQEMSIEELQSWIELFKNKKTNGKQSKG